MSKNREKIWRTVVLDGSNIVAQGVEDGNDGNILVSAIECYQKLGYRVIPVMKKGTVGWMKYKEEPGYAIMLQMVRSGQLRTFEQGDDEGVIQIAMDEKINAWIITYDTFWYDKKDKNGETILSERKAQPEWNWDDIDSRTRGTELDAGKRPRSGHHWSVVGSEFFDPTMPKAPKELLSSEYSDFYADLQIVIGKMNRITGFLESSDSELKKRMLNNASRISMNVSNLIEMIPPPEIPDESTVNTFLLDECKDLIRQINQIDEEAKLPLKGNRDELRARINEYAEKVKDDRKKTDKEERSRLKELREDTEAAEEAGVTLGKYRKSLKRKEISEREEPKEREIKAESNAIMGSSKPEFTKPQFASALMECKGDSQKREPYASLYQKLIQRRPEFNLKKHGIRANIYLEECSELIDFEIITSEDGVHEHYWI